MSSTNNRYQPYNLRSKSAHQQCSSLTSSPVANIPKRDRSKTPVGENVSSDAQSPCLYSDVVTSRSPSSKAVEAEGSAPGPNSEANSSLSSISSIGDVIMNLEPSMADEGSHDHDGEWTEVCHGR
ncbi:hypothetical protein QCA50_018400 [Cerrena zonata]|uniref:Uncharacterized protein n=1 Tax=Cerrena zonata TaxID=2478898 RepID=A0AAW0FLR6_9APHY